MGDTSAPVICTEAIYKTADQFQKESEAAAKLLKTFNYVDDLMDSYTCKDNALKVTGKTEAMLAKGGFEVKCWQLSGQQGYRKG